MFLGALNRTYSVSFLLAAFLLIFLTACTKETTVSSNGSSANDTDSAINIVERSEEIPLASGIAASDMDVVASGTLVNQNEKIMLDYSNTSDGYVMVKYWGNNQKVKTQITGPSGVTYTYNQSLTGDYDVYVLSDGNGRYTVAVYENTAGTSYATAFSYVIEVSLQDEFAPFLRSNKYVNYNASSKVVAVAAELCKDKANTNDKITAIYQYVVSNLSYDYQLANNVNSGYVPDLNSVLANKTGICFDYAAVMTAMLRSQGIPTKMVFGYTGSVYHAWISTYSEESGWIAASIYFNGKEWKLMDPTFASTGKSSEKIMEYIGNGANYVTKYLY